MTSIGTARKRLDHVRSIVDSVENHVEDSADSQALTKALGLLEQADADLEELGEEPD